MIEDEKTLKLGSEQIKKEEVQIIINIDCSMS